MNEELKKPTKDAERWDMELKAARKSVETWHTTGAKVVKRYLDERDDTVAGRGNAETCWTLFTSNVQTQQAMMYGQLPRVTVGRRYSDAADDEARVAGVISERLLNTDIEKDDDTFREALENCLEDFLIPGMGSIWLRYAPTFETVAGTPAMKDEAGNDIPGTEVPATEKKSFECVESSYVHWRDELWSPCRVYADARWRARRVQMTREELEKRFGKEKAALIPLNAPKKGDNEQGKAADPWSRADVWEIWDKEHKEAVWHVEGHADILDKQADPLGLSGFFPSPRPMMANTTTTAMVPKPTFTLTQDITNEIDLVSTRITLLERAVRVAGMYDKGSPEVAQLLGNSADNKMYPMENFAAFSEKGGIQGVMAFLPLDQIVGALAILRDYRKELVEAYNQLSGMSDIMRGQASNQATATEQRIKANFGSVRMQRLQNEFARFASDAQRIKFEIIAKHFDAQSIITQSNIMRTADAKLAESAVALIKSEAAQFRVEVKPEAISLTDFAAEKQDASEFITGLATFLQAATPLAQAMPTAMPHLLEMLQWSMSKFRGAGEIEGVLDRAIEESKKAAQQPQQQAPDPKMQALQMKGQLDVAKEEKKLQADLVRMSAQVQADDAREKSQAEWNTREAQAKASIPKPQPANGGAPR